MRLVRAVEEFHCGKRQLRIANVREAANFASAQFVTLAIFFVFPAHNASSFEN